jgi:hypothetical protein
MAYRKAGPGAARRWPESAGQAREECWGGYSQAQDFQQYSRRLCKNGYVVEGVVRRRIRVLSPLLTDGKRRPQHTPERPALPNSWRNSAGQAGAKCQD